MFYNGERDHIYLNKKHGDVKMANVYTAGKDRRLIIYSISRYIFLRTAYADGIERPIILAADYFDGLTEVIWNDTIYYAYQNQNKDIIVRNVLDTNIVYQTRCNENPDMHCPCLAVCNGKLVLFYMVTNPVTENMGLKCVLPMQSGLQVEVPTECDNIDMYQVYCVQGRLYLYTDVMYQVTEPGRYRCLIYQDEENNITETIAYYQRRIEELEATIESAKTQYNDLMETAISYRDEAIKWRSKFI